MGRRRLGDPAPEPEPTPEILSDAPDELEQAIAGLPQDSSVITLYRIPDQGKPRYVTKLTPEEFDLEQIKRQFGGGRFRYVALQDGIKVQQGHFEIEGDPILGPRREESSLVSRDVATLGEKLDKLVDALAAKPVSDTQEKLLTTLIAKLADRQNDGERFLAQLAALRAAGLLSSGGGGEQGSMLLEAVKLVKEGMMLGGGGEGGPPNPFMYAIEKLTPSIEKTVEALTAGKAPEKPVERPVLQVSEAFRPFVPLIRPYLPALVSAASVNSSPESWADIIEEAIPEKERESMRTWLRGETWFKDLAALDRRITLQAGWWQMLHNLLLEPAETEEPGGGEGEPEPEAA